MIPDGPIRDRSWRAAWTLTLVFLAVNSMPRSRQQPAADRLGRQTRHPALQQFPACEMTVRPCCAAAWRFIFTASSAQMAISSGSKARMMDRAAGLPPINLSVLKNALAYLAEPHSRPPGRRVFLCALGDDP